MLCPHCGLDAICSFVIRIVLRKTTARPASGSCTLLHFPLRRGLMFPPAASIHGSGGMRLPASVRIFCLGRKRRSGVFDLVAETSALVGGSEQDGTPRQRVCNREVHPHPSPTMRRPLGRAAPGVMLVWFPYGSSGR